MELISWIGKGIGGFLLTTFLAFLILDIGMIELTTESNIKPIISDSIQEQLDEQLTAEQLPYVHQDFIDKCESSASNELTLTSDEIGMPVDINLNCNRIKSSSPETITIVLAESAANDLYNKEYDCSVLECVKDPEKASVLISKKGHNFFANIKNYLIYGCLLGAGLIILFSRKSLYIISKNLGYSLFVTGLPFVLMGYITSAIKEKLPAELPAGFSSLFDNMIASMSYNYKLVFSIGIVLLVFGFLGSMIAEKVKKSMKKSEKKAKKKK